MFSSMAPRQVVMVKGLTALHAWSTNQSLSELRTYQIVGSNIFLVIIVVTLKDRKEWVWGPWTLTEASKYVYGKFIYTNVNTSQIGIWMYLYIYIYICIYVCVLRYIHVYSYIYIITYVHIHVYAYTWYVYIYIYICVFVFMYIHTPLLRNQHKFWSDGSWLNKKVSHICWLYPKRIQGAVSFHEFL